MRALSGQSEISIGFGVCGGATENDSLIVLRPNPPCQFCWYWISASGTVCHWPLCHIHVGSSRIVVGTIEVFNSKNIVPPEVNAIDDRMVDDHGSEQSKC